MKIIDSNRSLYQKEIKTQNNFQKTLLIFVHCSECLPFGRGEQGVSNLGIIVKTLGGAASACTIQFIINVLNPTTNSNVSAKWKRSDSVKLLLSYPFWSQLDPKNKFPISFFSQLP